MGYSRQCSSCPHSIGGGPDPLCDICDGCRSDRDTGWCGYTNYSIRDEDGDSIHSYDEIFFDDLIIDDDDYDYF